MRTTADIRDCVHVALRQRPADLVVKGARVFDLATGELALADIAIHGARIAAVGEGYAGERVLDARGLTAVPGFVDAHCHIESSLLTPYEWERLVLPPGVTAAVCDPHELANVAGAAAIDYFRACACRCKSPRACRPCPPRRPGRDSPPRPSPPTPRTERWPSS